MLLSSLENSEHSRIGRTDEQYADSSVTIQTSSQSVPATHCWLGEESLIAHHQRHYGMLALIEERVCFAHRCFGHSDLIDFVVVLLGYTIKGERTLETFYKRLQPLPRRLWLCSGRVGCRLWHHAPIEEREEGAIALHDGILLQQCGQRLLVKGPRV